MFFIIYIITMLISWLLFKLTVKINATTHESKKSRGYGFAHHKYTYGNKILMAIGILLPFLNVCTAIVMLVVDTIYMIEEADKARNENFFTRLLNKLF